MAKSKVKKPLVVGIDLGTTFSAVATYNADGKSEVISNKDGERTTPSVVNLQDEKKPVVGRAAVNALAFQPTFTVSLVKRIMGKVDASNVSVPAFVHPDSGRTYLPEEISACILRHLKEGAEQATGRKVGEVVISVPAYFNDAARLATRKAGELAGLKVLRIINEPTAAAIAYGWEKGREGRILVSDFGGGTWDVTIIEVRGDDYRVLATDGDCNLGGSDIDNELAALAARQFKEATGEDIPSDPDLAGWYDVIDKVQKAKKDLSTAESTSFVLSGKGGRLVIDLSRAEFNEIIKPFLPRGQTLVENCLSASGLSWADIDDVLLVGGSSRIPAVQEMVGRISGKTPRMDISPDEAIAMGAAMVAAQEASKTGQEIVDGRGAKVLPPPVTIVDVNAHPLGCLALNGQGVLQNSVIIPANSPLPTEREGFFRLLFESQTQVRIRVVQGPPGAEPQDCLAIGEVLLDGLPPGPIHLDRIKVVYSYDVDGIVHVTATDSVSGKSTNGRIEHRAGLTRHSTAA